MSDLIKIAVDAMGGDGSPKKIIDGIIFNHSSNKNNSLIEFLLPSLNPSPDAAPSARPPEINRRKFTEVRRNPQEGLWHPKKPWQ